MSFRIGSAVASATLILLAACQSVHTQPVVSSDPSALANSTPTPTPPGTPAPAPAPEPAATPAPAPPPEPAAAPSPAPTAHPKKLSYSSVEGVGKVIAMTFDDGPHPKLTPKLLDILKERGIKATFFLVGENAIQYPDIIRRMVAEGHEVANHSWNHPSLTRLGTDGIRSQIERTNAAIEKAIGHPPTLIRPPYGATSARLDRWFADQYGMTVVLWSVDPLDWKYRNSERVKSQILAQVKPGAIILSHDIHATTVAAMPETLDALEAQGYKFVTVSELIAMAQAASAPTAAPDKPAPSPDPTPLKLDAVPTPTPAPFEVKRFDLISPE